MLPDWIERCLDFLAPRIAAEASADVTLDPQSFARFTDHLIAVRELRLRSEREQSVTLETPGRLFGNLNKVIPKLRYQLDLCSDGRVRVDVFEHVFCSRRSREAVAVEKLCNNHLQELLKLLAEWQAAEETQARSASE